MDKIYQNKKGHKLFSAQKIPTKTGDYLYFLKIGENRMFKIGTSNNILRRMKEHLKYYEENIRILWISPKYSKYTTLRIEDKQKGYWREFEDWEYVNNDRFIIPEKVEEITITVRKDYKIKI